MASDGHVRIVSPASPTKKDSVRDGVSFLESMGLRVSLGKHVFANDGYLAGSDEERASDLMDAFLNPDVDAVMCSRGGYGCARLMGLLDLDAIANTGKMFVGFSDVTTLHLALNRRGLVTFHAPMLLTFSVEREPWVYESFKNILTGKDPFVAGAPKGETLRPGVAEGSLTGGCLCLLTDSLATPDAVDCDGKIVLIEDVDENPHRVDAMLTHFINAGVLAGAKGIVVGEMTGTDERQDPKIGAWPWRRIVEDRLAAWNVPTIVDYPIGHKKNMLSLPLGVQVRLDADAGTLELLETACA